MASQSGQKDSAQAAASPPPSIPAMPSVPPEELYRGAPYLLSYTLRHSLGWQDDRKAGRSFVVVRLSRLDTAKVTDRFPLTEQGWADAWQVLSGRDASAATAIAARLSTRDGRERASSAFRALNAESLCYLRRMKYNGGSGEARLAKGQGYDVRFLGDRLVVCQPGEINAIVEVPYTDVETVEVSGPEQTTGSGSSTLAWMFALGLLGALLGLFILGLAGLLLGALIFGAIGAAVGANSARIETTVRIRGKDAELYFLSTEYRPDALRIEMSRPLRAVERANAAEANDTDGAEHQATESVPDRLTQLASLLQQGLITRQEFEHLKAKLIAES
jgi:hypothetical protein